MITSKLKELAEELYLLKQNKEVVEKKLKEINEQITNLQPRFVEAMEDENIDKFSVPKLGTFSLFSGLYPKVENEEVMVEDLRAKGYQSIIKQVVNWQTLRALVNELIGQNRPIPEGVSVTPVKEVRLRKENND